MSNHYDNGTHLPYLDNWILYENKWRATRYGIDADLIVDEDGNQASIIDEIISTINNLSPEIEDLKISSNMDRIITKINSGHGYYKNQMNVYAKNKEIKDVIRSDIWTLKDS